LNLPRRAARPADQEAIFLANKYDDWQRYVREQMERTEQKKREAVPSVPKRPVPSIDRDKFTITRQQPAAPESSETAAKTPAPQSPLPAQQKAAPESRKTPRKQEPDEAGARQSRAIASPFVSVQDIWEAAERSTKTRKTAKEESLPAIQQKRLPGIEKVTRVDPSEQEAAQRQRRADTKSREEILERLVNPTLTLEEAAKVMGVCKATVRRYTAKGILPHYRTPGNQRRFKLNDILSFLESQRK
jgi:excisionase family DNA binding protein